MNSDVLKGKWKQVKGDVQAEWGKLTDDDVKRVDGEFDSLVGKLQERYGFEREAAEQKAKAFVNKVSSKFSS